MKSPTAITSLLLCFLSGCIPFAWITPPSKAEVAVGPKFEPGQENDPALAVPLRVGMYPLQAFREMGGREVDAGVGYQVWTGSSLYWPHGPYLDVTYLYPLPQHPRIRLHVTAKGHALNRAVSGWGFGASLQVGIEFIDFANGPFESCDSDGCAVGSAYGEGGIDFFLDGSRVIFAQSDLTFIGGGIGFRIPATFGVGFAWLDDW